MWKNAISSPPLPALVSRSLKHERAAAAAGGARLRPSGSWRRGTGTQRDPRAPNGTHGHPTGTRPCHSTGLGIGEQLWLLQRHQVANSQHKLREQAASAGFILHSGRESTVKALLVFEKEMPCVIYPRVNQEKCKRSHSCCLMLKPQARGFSKGSGNGTESAPSWALWKWLR